MLEKQKLSNLLNIFIIAPILYTLATNQFPEKYRGFVLWLVFLMIIINFYNLILITPERMQNIDQINQILISDTKGFDTPNITINKGESIMWTNNGQVEHTITEDNGMFNSGYMKPHQSHTVEFNNSGVYQYHCAAHKWMKGIVIVK